MTSSSDCAAAAVFVAFKACCKKCGNLGIFSTAWWVMTVHSYPCCSMSRNTASWHGQGGINKIAWSRRALDEILCEWMMQRWWITRTSPAAIASGLLGHPGPASQLRWFCTLQAQPGKMQPNAHLQPRQLFPFLSWGPACPNWLQWGPGCTRLQTWSMNAWMHDALTWSENMMEQKPWALGPILRSNLDGDRAANLLIVGPQRLHYASNPANHSSNERWMGLH